MGKVMSNQSYRGYAKALHLCELHLLSGIALVTLLAMLLLLSFPSMGVALPAGVYTVQAQAQSAQNVGHYDVVDIARSCLIPEHVAHVNEETIRVTTKGDVKGGLSKYPEGSELPIATWTSSNHQIPCHPGGGNDPITVLNGVAPALDAIGSEDPVSHALHVLIDETAGALIASNVQFDHQFDEFSLELIVFGAGATAAPGAPLDLNQTGFYNITAMLFSPDDWANFYNLLIEGEDVKPENLDQFATHTLSIDPTTECTSEPLPSISLGGSFEQHTASVHERGGGSPQYPLENYFPEIFGQTPTKSSSSLSLRTSPQEKGAREVTKDTPSQTQTLNMGSVNSLENSPFVNIDSPQPTSAVLYTPNHITCLGLEFPQNVSPGPMKVVYLLKTNISQLWNVFDSNAPDQADTEVSFIQLVGGAYKFLIPPTPHPAVAVSLTVQPGQ